MRGAAAVLLVLAAPAAAQEGVYLDRDLTAAELAPIRAHAETCLAACAPEGRACARACPEAGFTACMAGQEGADRSIFLKLQICGRGQATVWGEMLDDALAGLRKQWAARPYMGLGALEEAQTAWGEWRAKECEFAGAVTGHNPSAHVEYETCEGRLIAERALALRPYLESE